VLIFGALLHWLDWTASLDCAQRAQTSAKMSNLKQKWSWIWIQIFGLIRIRIGYVCRSCGLLSRRRQSFCWVLRIITILIATIIRVKMVIAFIVISSSFCCCTYRLLFDVCDNDAQRLSNKVFSKFVFWLRRKSNSGPGDATSHAA